MRGRRQSERVVKPIGAGDHSGHQHVFTSSARKSKRKQSSEGARTEAGTEDMRVNGNRLIRVLAGICACAGLLGGPASAQSFLYDNIPGSLPPPTPPNSAAVNNSFSAIVGGNAITSLQADDIRVTNLPSGTAPVITRFDFIVTNLDVPNPNPDNPNHPGAGQTAVRFRPRLRMWNSNAVGNAPTNLLQTGLGGTAAFDLPAVTLPAPAAGSYSSALISFDLTPFGGVNIPGTSPNIFIGLVFDDENGALAPGLSDPERLRRMNNIGLFIHNPINQGSSADQVWANAQGGSYDVNNPAGSLQSSANYGLPPTTPLNFAFRVTLLTIPEPGAGGLLLVTALPVAATLVRRRMRRGKPSA
jgi:hypothetical protein